MKINYEPHRAEYDKAWAKQHLSFLQHWLWGETRRPANVPHRLMIDDMPAQVLVRKLPATGGQFGYLAWAFNKDFLNSIDLAALSQELTKRLQLSHLIIEPYVYSSDEPDSSNWRRQGFVIDHRTVNARHSNLLDVTKSDDELLAAMEHDARRRVKQALARDGITCREDSSEAGLRRFYECLHAVSKRSRFVIKDQAYFTKIYEAFKSTQRVHLLFVERGPELLYASFALADNDILRRLYGGPTPAGRREPAGHLLLWESVKLARSLGLRHIDFFGVAPYTPAGFDHKHSLYGISKFKAGFGGQNITYLPQLIWVRNPVRFRAYQTMLQTHRGIIYLRKLVGT